MYIKVILSNNWPYFKWKICGCTRSQIWGIISLLSHYGVIWLPEYSYLSVCHDKTSIIIFGMTEIPE